MASLSPHRSTNALQYCTLPSPQVGNLHSSPRRRRRRRRRRCRSPITATTFEPSATSERDEWVSNVRNTTGRVNQRLWAPYISLEPPPLLADIAVVLVSPKRPTSVGSVARALSCFECMDLRLVNPRCDHLARPSRKGSKGAQYLLWRASKHENLEDAIKGASATVAFTRWLDGLHGVPSYRSTKEFLKSLLVDLKKQQQQQQPQQQQQQQQGENCINSSSGEEEGHSGSGKASSQKKLVLVFGREEEGLRPEEVAACSAACSIPIGRLQESLSLSHAVSLVLSPLFEARQESLSVDSGKEVMIDSRDDLAEGIELQDD